MDYINQAAYSDNRQNQMQRPPGKNERENQR